MNVEVHIADAKRLKRWAEWTAHETTVEHALVESALVNAVSWRRLGMLYTTLDTAGCLASFLLAWAHSWYAVPCVVVALFATWRHTRTTSEHGDLMGMIWWSKGRMRGMAESAKALLGGGN